MNAAFPMVEKIPAPMTAAIPNEVRSITPSVGRDELRAPLLHHIPIPHPSESDQSISVAGILKGAWVRSSEKKGSGVGGQGSGVRVWSSSFSLLCQLLELKSKLKLELHTLTPTPTPDP